MAKTGKLTALNGWSNLATVTGMARARMVRVYNASAAVLAYVHVNDSATQPATGADGYPFSAAAGAPGVSGELMFENVDLAGVWVFTPSALDIKYLVI